METFPLPQPNTLIRRATPPDLPGIIQLLADDALGQTREVWQEPLPENYQRAFEAIAADPMHFLAVVEQNGKIVGTFQLSFIPGISHQGSTRAQIEAVRVAAHLRGHGLGEAMMRWAIEYSRAKGCKMVQLTTDKTRTKSLRFYKRLGFLSTHEGMKLKL